MSSPSSLRPKPTQQGHRDSLVSDNKDWVQEGRSEPVTRAVGSQFSAPRGVLEQWVGGNPPCLACQAGGGGGVLSVLLSLQGTACHVRVSAYNMKGWGPPQASTPPFAIPSSEYPRSTPMGASAGRGGTGQLPVPSGGPSHCWDGSEWTQGQGRIWSLNQAG